MSTSDRGGLTSGMVIGGYELDRRIGKGGMAEVWVARKAQSRVGKFVAVKAILPHLAVPGRRDEGAGGLLKVRVDRIERRNRHHSSAVRNACSEARTRSLARLRR